MRKTPAARILHDGLRIPRGIVLASRRSMAGSASLTAAMEFMTEPVTGSASPHELAMASLKAAHEALACLVESARQAQNLASQSADVMATGTAEFHEMALRHAREHLELSFPLAQGLADAIGLSEVLRVLNGFARETGETCARQADELSRFAAQFAPRPSLVGSSDDFIGEPE